MKQDGLRACPAQLCFSELNCAAVILPNQTLALSKIQMLFAVFFIYLFFKPCFFE
uniref:Uncharacterized protein n=1 Tax=Anguilla anguilla TaxID=7936 RepID=A0A0E9W700_ANGAN